MKRFGKILTQISLYFELLRPKTLIISIVTICSGSTLAAHYQVNNSLILLFCLLLTALNLQIISNLANDYGDKNLDKNRLASAPRRLLSLGLVSRNEVKIMLIIATILASIFGLLTIFISAFYYLIPFGLSALYAAFNYTLGAKPYGYRALGELFVFLFFGLIGVMGSAFILLREWQATFIAPAISWGAGSTLVLYTNNLRDLENDIKFGKITLAQKLNQKIRFKFSYFLGLLQLIFLVFSSYQLKINSSFYIYLFLISIFYFFALKNNNFQKILLSINAVQILWIIFL